MYVRTHERNVITYKTHCLEDRFKSGENGNGVLGGGGALSFVLLGGGKRDGLNGKIELLGGFLLLLGIGKVGDGSTGFVHVSAHFFVHVGPLFLGTVAFQLSETLLGFCENGLLLDNVLGGSGLVEGVLSGSTVDRVRGVRRRRLIGTVGGSLGVTGTVSEKTEDRESRGLSGGGVGGGGDQGSSGGGDSCKGIPTSGVLLLCDEL